MKENCSTKPPQRKIEEELLYQASSKGKVKNLRIPEGPRRSQEALESQAVLRFCFLASLSF